MRSGTQRKKQRQRQSSVSPPSSVPFLDLDHQIVGTDIDNGTFVFLNFVGLGIKFRFDSFCYGFLDSLSKCLFSQFQKFAFVFFFRVLISLKILILVQVFLFLILMKSLVLNKYRVECCIDIYFRFFCRITINNKVIYLFIFSNLGIEYDLGLNFLVGLLYPTGTTITKRNSS